MAVVRAWAVRKSTLVCAVNIYCSVLCAVVGHCAHLDAVAQVQETARKVLSSERMTGV